MVTAPSTTTSDPLLPAVTKRTSTSIASATTTTLQASLPVVTQTTTIYKTTLPVVSHNSPANIGVAEILPVPPPRPLPMVTSTASLPDPTSSITSQALLPVVTHTTTSHETALPVVSHTNPPYISVAETTPVPPPRPLPMVTSTSFLPDLPQNDQTSSLEDTTSEQEMQHRTEATSLTLPLVVTTASDYSVSDPTLTHPYQSMPVFPEPMIYVVEMNDATQEIPEKMSSRSVSAEPLDKEDTQPEPTTSTTMSGPSIQCKTSSTSSPTKPLLTTQKALPVVTDPLVPSGKNEASQGNTENLGIKHDFIEVLSVEGDEVLHLHTMDIYATKCTIRSDKLTVHDIENCKLELKEQCSLDTQQDDDAPSLTKRK